MTVAQAILLALNLSMGIIVLSLGLHARLGDIAYLMRRPGLLVRSVVAMNVIMPLLAAAAVAALKLNPAIEIAIIALALSPVPPILPPKQTKAGGDASYVIALLVATAVIAIVLVPLGVYLLSKTFGVTASVPSAKIASVVLMTVIAPLLVGMIVRALAPDFAQKIAGPASLIGAVLLVVAFVPVLLGQWRLIISMVGNGTLLVLAAFTLVGVVVGHLLGGPEAANRSVLALATGTRHPGVALAIASATFPAAKGVLAVVLWHLVVSGIVSGPYVKWRQRARVADRTQPTRAPNEPASPGSAK
jgi:BASS family bile acid:Na+ symporter